ncbi:MAG: ABC transporter permease [Oscillospiraceae bacterium]|jgi:putative ABC transport system permease protein|nr:ABC transporter permease [Oscillospiraceae bacterium]
MRRLTPLRLSLANASRRPYRAVGIAALVAALTFALVGGSLLALGMRSGVTSLRGRLGADALLVPGGYEADAEGALLRGEPSAFWFEASLASRLADNPDIERSTPQLFIASFDSEHCDAAVQFIGYEPETDFLIAPWLTESVPGGPGDGEIVVGARVRGKTGGTLKFFGRDYLVAGRLEETGMGFDTSVFVNMKTARDALIDYVALGGKGGPEGEAGAVSSLAVDIKPGVSPSDFSRGVRYEFRTENVGVVLTQAVLGSVSGGLSSLFIFIAAVVALLWAMTVVVLAILFSVSVNERRREFGIYRALGATRGALSRLVIMNRR